MILLLLLLLVLCNAGDVPCCCFAGAIRDCNGRPHLLLLLLLLLQLLQSGL